MDSPGERDEHRGLRPGLRREVVQLRSRGRGTPAPQLHAGEPGGVRDTFPPGPDAAGPDAPGPFPGALLDPALRTEVAAALLGRALRRAPDPVLWLSRGRVPRWHDEDAAWLWPAVTAYAERGLPARFLVVTPVGWYDPRSGEGVTWRRPRLR